MKIVEPAVGTLGDVSPLKLASSVAKNNQGTYGIKYGGGGRLADVADAADVFARKPPQSGTAPRALMYHLLAAGAGAGAGYGAGGDVGSALQGALVGGLLGRTVSRTMNDPALVQALINKGTGRMVPTGRDYSTRLLSGAAPFAGRQITGP
jgi:hypothetical protein